MPRRLLLCLLPVTFVLAGCASPKVDFAKIQRPPRAADLDAYDVFVGQWDWQATLLNAAVEEDKEWRGTAEWQWALDQRCLHGMLSARSARSGFEAAGIWSRDPKKSRYIWWMFNNWGYPQQGTAAYEPSTRTWTMRYSGIGLDGTAGRGIYEIKVVDNDTLEWTMTEYAPVFPGFDVVKMTMKGTYHRRTAPAPGHAPEGMQTMDQAGPAASPPRAG